MSVNITEDDSDYRAQSEAIVNPPSCPKGYAVYAFENSKKLVRLGSSTCLDPTGGEASSAPSSIMISAALSGQLKDLMEAHPDFEEIRCAVCCKSGIGTIHHGGM